MAVEELSIKSLGTVRDLEAVREVSKSCLRPAQDVSGGCLGAVWEVSKGCSGGIHFVLLTNQTIFMHGFSHFAAPVALPGFFAVSSSLSIFVLLNRACPLLFCGAPAATPLPISAATWCTQADGSTRGTSLARTASSTPSGGLTTPTRGALWGGVLLRTTNGRSSCRRTRTTSDTCCVSRRHGAR